MVRAQSTSGPAIKSIDYATLLTRFGEKDRQNLERQIAQYEEKLGPDPAARWRRLACLLLTLAPHAPKISSAHRLQFFIPDGKYKMQVFALQGFADGSLAVYCPDVLAAAVKAKIVARLSRDGNLYRISDGDEAIEIDPLDASTPNPDPVFKDMTGWNRKAIRLVLPPTATSVQVGAVEKVCGLAVTWPAPAKKA